MSESTAAMQRIGSGAGRVARAWRMLPADRRLAAVAALGLLLCLFLPWYQVTVITGSRASTLVSTMTLTGWGAFAFVEAVVLLVAGAVLALLFVRAENRALPLPEYDGVAILSAGAFTALLILWRILDKGGTTGQGQSTTVSGIEWGIIFALVAALVLTYAGSRIRSAAPPEAPPAPAGKVTPPPPGDPSATRVSKPRGTDDQTATHVSKRPRPSALFGPPVLPEDPPTMRLETREHQVDPTVPLDKEA